MKLKSIESLLFLSYLTEYNIGEIHKAFEYASKSDFIYDYIRYRNESGKFIDQKIVSNAEFNAAIAFEKLKYLGISVISIFDETYPANLKNINNPPPLLYIKGKFKRKKGVAIIGSRSTSQFALSGVIKAVDLFVEKKYSIVSGLAIGIDTFAHEQTIKQKGYTIAVMPSSLDTIYPQENFALANKILESGGSLISEIPLGINRGKRSFVERNRIQAGLSDIVMPIEMRIDSGTMHTIRFAYQQKKKILLVTPSVPKKELIEYSGILSLIESKKDNANTIIVDEDYSWKNIVRALKNKNQMKIPF